VTVEYYYSSSQGTAEAIGAHNQDPHAHPALEHFRGYFATKAEIDALATPGAGDYAFCAQVVAPASTANKWVYSADQAKWVDSGVKVPDQMVPASTATPLMDGTGAVGSETKYARGDHRHPEKTATLTDAAASATLPAAGVATALTALAQTARNNFKELFSYFTNGKANSAAVADSTTGVTGTLPIASGGTGATTAEDATTNLGAVPTTRKVNNKALSADISLGAADVGALSTAGGAIVNDASPAFDVTDSGGTVELRTTAASVDKPLSIVFHRQGFFAVRFGIDTDNKLKAGGWSAGTVPRHILPRRVTANYPANQASANVSVPGALATSYQSITVSVAVGQSAAVNKAAAKAGFYCTGQGSNVVALACSGTTPTIAIPLEFVLEDLSW
jgi:hypothetical protein